MFLDCQVEPTFSIIINTKVGEVGETVTIAATWAMINHLRVYSHGQMSTSMPHSSMDLEI